MGLELLPQKKDGQNKTDEVCNKAQRESKELKAMGKKEVKAC